MQSGKMHPDWMQWIPCSVVECSGFHAGWRNGTLLNAVVFFAAWFNAVESTQHDCMQWIYAAWPKASRFNAVDSMQRDGMKCIPYSVKLWNIIVGSGFYAAWLSAVDSMKHDWMQWILCSMAQSIPIEYSGFHEASMNARIPCIFVQWIPIECSEFHAAWLNAVHSMQHGKMHPD